MTTKYRGMIPPPNIRQEFTESIQRTFFGYDGTTERSGLLVLVQEVLSLRGSEYSLVRGSCIEVDNLHKNPTEHFAIDRSQFREIQALSEVLAVVGCVHTHDNTVSPSTDDIDQLPDDLLGVILHVPSGATSFYTCDGAARYRRRKA